MAKPFAEYTNRLKMFMETGKRRNYFEKSLNESYASFTGPSEVKLLSADKAADELLFQSLPFGNLTAQAHKNLEKPGAHPDFHHIKERGVVENHYITSMFIDISKSTSLFRRYEPFTVANITTTIQKAALHTCWRLNGYIQRFHGDGLLAYFGGRTTTLTDSVRNALDAASLFTYFVKNDLQELFSEQGVENIYTRIGIDAGRAEDVLWHLAGIGDCSEITTCSLHTSLAAHMQGNADSNGIMVGDNVKDSSFLPPDLYSIKKKDGKEERYIYQIPEENFNYTQWVFNWERHLRNHPLSQFQPDGSLEFGAVAPAVIPTQPKNVEYLRQQAQGYKPYGNE